MSRLKALSLSVSIDGFMAGPNQSLEQPLGEGGMALHPWALGTRTFQQMHGGEGGSTGPDDDFMRAGFDRIGAWILGRNMYGPVRGPWPDDQWKGWWGNDPPYHCPVFVLTHHARDPIVTQGGTVFHFVTGGIHEALARARAAAGGFDVRVGGGAATVRQYLQAGLIDELHLAISPAVLGRGESLLAGIDLVAAGFRVTRHESTPAALHVVLRKG